MNNKKASPAWLVWAGLLIAGVALVAALAGQPAASQALSPLAVTVDKSVDHLAVLPGHLPAPLYTVTFSNPYTTPVVLDWITDTLPAGFTFVNMDPSSDWDEDPVDQTEPGIVWQGPITIPATGTLSLVYAVYVPSSVPRSPVPYQNTVIATAGAQLIGPASAGLIVGGPEFGLAKTASATRVLNGEVFTYTVTIPNSGEVAGPIDSVADTLDPSLSFVRMAPGSGLPDPAELPGGVLLWTGPFTVPVGGELEVQYQVAAPGGTAWSWPCNEVVAWAGDTELGPERVCIEVGPGHAANYLPLVLKHVAWARFSIAKTAAPTTVMSGLGQVVTYTVTLVNDGDRPGVLGSVVDTLPAGFTYLDMAPGSDVTADPSGTTGMITWAGPFNVPGHGQLRLVYKVTPSDAPGQYTNLATATPLVGHGPYTPASAVVNVEPGILLQENFDLGIAAWTPFLNYHRLQPGQWYWGAQDGINGSGALTHDCCTGSEVAGDAVMMYLQPGSENWTNYRVETKMYLTGGVKNNGDPEPNSGDPIGLWVRGHYQEGEPGSGKWLDGYYIVLCGKSDGPNHWLRLSQMRQVGDCGTGCREQGLNQFNNPMILTESELVPGPFAHYRWYDLAVEVRGNNIKAWVDGQLLIDYTDEILPYMTGTVGYKVHETKTASFDDLIVTQLP